MAQYKVPSGADPIDFLLRENENLKNRVQALEGRRLSTWDRADQSTIAAPVEGQHLVNMTTEKVHYYSDGAWRQVAPPIYHIKVVADTQTIATGDGRFIWAVPQDLVSHMLTDVEMDVTTVSSSGIVQVQLRNVTQAVDMLTTRVQVDANEFHSKDAATQPVVNTANADVQHGDRIAIDIDAAGTGAKGLGVVLTFGPV